MNESTPVTRVRVELTPSLLMHEIMNQFLREPVADGKLKLYTTAQQIVPQVRYHREISGRQMPSVERQIQAVGRGAVKIVGLHETLEVAGRVEKIFFNVHEQDQYILDGIRALLSKLPTLEAPHTLNSLYMEVALGSLKKDAAARKEVAEKLASQARHPTASQRIYANNARVKTQDFPAYLIERPASSYSTTPLI